MKTGSVNSPGQILFDGNVEANWIKYRQRFLLYLVSEKNVGQVEDSAVIKSNGILSIRHF